MDTDASALLFINVMTVILSKDLFNDLQAMVIRFFKGTFSKKINKLKFKLRIIIVPAEDRQDKQTICGSILTI